MLGRDWDDVPLPQDRRATSPEAENVFAILEAACETRASASLMAAHMALSCTGRLCAVAEGGVVVQLSHPPSEPLLPGAACAMTFVLAGRSVGCTARATVVVPGPADTLMVTLALPSKLRHNEQRVSVRIPVVRGGLTATVLRGEQRRPVKVIDISLHGLLIEIDRAGLSDLEEGHRRMLELVRDERTIVLEAEVRRQDGQRYGMAFIMRDAPPRDLVQILRELQQLWWRSEEGQ
jgi:hypothetical protein